MKLRAVSTFHRQGNTASRHSRCEQNRISKPTSDSSNDPEMLIDKMNDKLQSLTLEDSSIRISDAKAVMSSTLFYIKTHFSHAAAGKLVGIDLVSEEVN